MAAEEEAKRVEAARHRRWAEEDADREARRRMAEEDRLRWEDMERKRREMEDREIEERNRMDRMRREQEKMDREREDRERKERNRREKEQRDRDLEERKRQTEETLKQKVREDLENAKEYKKMMPSSYENPVQEPPEKIRQPRAKSKFLSLIGNLLDFRKDKKKEEE